MTSEEARAALAARGHHGRAANALAAHLGDNLSLTQAAKRNAVNIAAVIRLRDKFSVETTCPCCGHVQREVKLV